MRLVTRPSAKTGGTPTMGVGGRAAPRLVSGGLIDAIVPASLEFRESYFVLGDQYCRVLVVLAYPPRVPPAWLARLFSIPGVTGSVHLTPADPSLLVRQISASISEFRQRLQTMRNPLVIQRTQQSLQDAEAMLGKIDAEQQQVFTLSVWLLIRAGSLEELNKRTRAVEARAAAASMRARVIQFAQSDGAVAAGPFAWLPEPLEDIAPRQVPAETAAAAFPFVAGGLNTGRGVVWGRARDSSLVLFDRWSQEGGLTNGNVNIFGSSGSGKSVTSKLLLLREYAQGVRVLVIDPQGEYIPLAQALGGKVVDAAGGRGRINPHQIPAIPGEDGGGEDGAAAQRPLAQHIQRLKTFYSLYLPGLDTFEQATLEDAILEAYRAKGVNWHTDPASVREWPTVADVRAALQRRPGAQRLAVLLKSAVEGADSALWNGQSTVEIGDADFVVLDITRVKEAASNVRRAQFFNVLTFAWDLVREGRARREHTILLVDEAWMLVDPQTPQALNFLFEAVKTIRKFGPLPIGASLSIATQNIGDFLSPEVERLGKPVVANAAIKLLLRHEPQEMAALRQAFDLTDAEAQLLANAKPGEGLLIAGNNRAWVQVEPAPHELAIIDPERAKALGGGE